jgi:hypothetical protein
MTLFLDKSRSILTYAMYSILIILFIIAVIYTLVIKPRNILAKRLLDMNTTITPFGELLHKTTDITKNIGNTLKNTAEKQLDTIKGKLIKISDNYDDLSAELKETLSKCYEDGGCIF